MLQGIKFESKIVEISAVTQTEIKACSYAENTYAVSISSYKNSAIQRKNYRKGLKILNSTFFRK